MAKKRVIQWYGSGQQATLTAFELALAILRKTKLPVVLGPPSARDVSAAGIWIQGDEGAVGEFAQAFEVAAKKAGVEIAPADYARVGK